MATIPIHAKGKSIGTFYDSHVLAQCYARRHTHRCWERTTMRLITMTVGVKGTDFTGQIIAKALCSGCQSKIKLQERSNG